MNTTFGNLENRSNDFLQNLVLHIFRAREDDLDRIESCKKILLSVCHSIHEKTSGKSREPLNQFSENLVLYVFRAREDDQDMSQTCKKSDCLSVGQ